MGAGDHVPRFNDRLKAGMAAAANLFFLVAVSTIWAIERSFFQGHQLTGIAPFLFIIAALLLILYFATLAASDRR